MKFPYYIFDHFKFSFRIFIFDDNDQNLLGSSVNLTQKLKGKSFEQCEDIINISLQNFQFFNVLLAVRTSL